MSVSLPCAIDGLARRQDGRGGLHRKARHDVLPRRDAAQNAAGIVGEKGWAFVAGAHLVGVLFAGKRGGGKARADLDALHRIDAHEGRREIRIELAVDGRAEPRGHAFGHDLDHGAAGGALPAHLFEKCRERFGSLRVRAPEGIARGLRPVEARALDLQGPHLDERAADRDFAQQVIEHLARNGAGCHARGGLARRLPPAAAIIADAVFGVIGVIGVARAIFIAVVGVVLRARVDILDDEADGRAGGERLPPCARPGTCRTRCARRRARGAGSHIWSRRAFACRANAGCRPPRAECRAGCRRPRSRAPARGSRPRS